jgi:bifunctional DNase/RNase
MPEEYEGPDRPEGLDTPPSFFSSEFGERSGADFGPLVEITVEGVFQSATDPSADPFVLLSDGARQLPIMIGFPEAQAISLPMENKEARRPMTHDLFRAALEQLGVEVDRVIIDDFYGGVYYAKLVLRQGDVEISLDARPSDSIALALRFDAPIFVADGIFDAAMEDR